MRCLHCMWRVCEKHGKTTLILHMNLSLCDNCHIRVGIGKSCIVIKTTLIKLHAWNLSSWYLLRSRRKPSICIHTLGEKSSVDVVTFSCGFCTGIFTGRAIKSEYVKISYGFQVSRMDRRSFPTLFTCFSHAFRISVNNALGVVSTDVKSTWKECEKYWKTICRMIRYCFCMILPS